jgi:hypothetical protein
MSGPDAKIRGVSIVIFPDNQEVRNSIAQVMGDRHFRIEVKDVNTAL